MKKLDRLINMPYFGQKDFEGLSKDDVDLIRDLASVAKETILSLSTIANIHTKDIFSSRDIARAALRKYRDFV